MWSRSGSNDLLWVIEGFLAADSFCRVKAQQLTQQVQCQGIGFRIQLVPLLFWFDRQRTDVSIDSKHGSRICGAHHKP